MRWKWKRKVAFPFSQIDDNVKHIFREHNQEADHRANLGAEGQRKIVVDRDNNNEKWKAVQDFWDGRSKCDGRSNCGVVIKGPDKKKWITISKIAVSLGTRTAMTAEVVGVCDLTGIQDIVFGKNLSMENISQCIDVILKSH